MKRFHFLFFCILLVGLISMPCISTETKQAITSTNADYSKLKENTVEDDKIEVEKDIIESILAASKENLQAAQNYHDSLRMIATTVRILVPLVPILVIVFAVSGWIGRRRVINWLYRELKFEEREAINRAEVCVCEGYEHYKIARNIYEENPQDPMYKRLVTLAAAYTENALIIIERIFNPERPRNKYEEFMVTDIFSNLAYFYAILQDEKKFPEGLRYAKWSFEKGEKYVDFDWIENYLFFISQFAASIPHDEKPRAKEAFYNYKKTLLAQGICTQQEVDDYKKIFSSF